jgi:hypothetical protein
VSLEPPPIDTRGYRELFEEALARIPVHTPEWTNRNEADPGVTLLQLWAYMSETLLYRSSLIPERNRIAFLRLLGYGRAPASAARGLVAFDNSRGRLEPVVLPSGIEVAAGNVPFRTDRGLAVLPVEAQAYVKQTVDLDPSEQDEVDEQYQAAYASFAEEGVRFAYYETTRVNWDEAERRPLDLADTVDGVLWLALLARPGDDVDEVRAALGDRILTLGIVPDERADQRVLRPAGSAPSDDPGFEVAHPDATAPLPERPDLRVPRYLPLETTGDTDLLTETGVLQVQLPGPDGLRTWDLDPSEDGVGAFPPALDSDDAERLVTWLRVRRAQEDGEAAAPAPPRLRWVGINAAMVRQRARVEGETLGTGTGRSDQTVTLASAPVLPDSVELTVDGRAWRRVEDLMSAGSEAPLVAGSAPKLTDPGERVSVYSLDAASGRIRFGDGIHGRRPPPGAVIAASYDHGGGRAGMVGPGAISKGVALPAGVKGLNPVATWAGDDGESVELAEKRIAGFVRHRDRLVTAEDFREIVARTPGVEIGRVEVLSLLHPSMPEVATPGVVTLLLIPRFDATNPATPEPDRAFLDAVCRYVDDRRLLTTELHLRGPEYRRVWVSVGIEVVPGREVAVVRDAVQRQIRGLLSPLPGGGATGGGWPLGNDVERLEIWAAAARVDGVAKVVGVGLAGADGVATDRVPIDGLELPRLAGLSVRRGDPRPVDELLGATPDVTTPALPIPFVPAEC